MTNRRHRPVQERHVHPDDLYVYSPSEETIDKMIEFWQPRYDRKLTREDGREIAVNLVGFFRILERWDREDRAKAAASQATRGGEAPATAVAPTPVPDAPPAKRRRGSKVTPTPRTEATSSSNGTDEDALTVEGGGD